MKTLIKTTLLKNQYYFNLICRKISYQINLELISIRAYLIKIKHSLSSKITHIFRSLNKTFRDIANKKTITVYPAQFQLKQRSQIQILA